MKFFIKSNWFSRNFIECFPRFWDTVRHSFMPLDQLVTMASLPHPVFGCNSIGVPGCNIFIRAAKTGRVLFLEQPSL